MKGIRVLIIDDHLVVREGIRAMLAAQGDFTVVGESANAEEAVAASKRTGPDVVLLDISMAGLSGIEAVPLILEAAPAARILMLSVHDDGEYVVKAVRAGAHGYVRKDTTPDELRGAVRAVHQGEGFFSPAVAGRLARTIREEAASEHAVRADVGALTGREREILAGIARGRLNKELAAELGISVRTVEAHRDNLTRKLGIRTAAALTRFAINSGLAEPD